MLKKSKCFKLRRLPNNDIQDVHTWPILSRQRIFFFKKICKKNKYEKSKNKWKIRKMRS